MRRINLLPPEERRRGLALPAGGVLGVLLIVGAVALVAMAGIYLLYAARINNEEERIAELDQQIAEQNRQLAELAPYKDLQARLDAKKPVADGIYRSRFAWDEFFQGLAFVIPETTALNSLSAEAAPVNLETASGQPLQPGAVTFTGISLPQYQNLSDFVVQMNNLRYLANTELNSAELNQETFARPAIDFVVASELVTVAGDAAIGQDRDELPLDEEQLSGTTEAAFGEPLDRSTSIESER